MPAIKSSADLRNNYNEISTFCHNYPEPVFITKNGTPVTFLIEKTDYNSGLLFFINSIKGKVIIDDYKTNFPTG